MGQLLAAAIQRACAMPRGGAIIFGDLLGKLDALEVVSDKCGRKERFECFV
jgi:hypothetical protein